MTGSGEMVTHQTDENQSQVLKRLGVDWCCDKHLRVLQDYYPTPHEQTQAHDNFHGARPKPDRRCLTAAVSQILQIEIIIRVLSVTHATLVRIRRMTLRNINRRHNGTRRITITSRRKRGRTSIIRVITIPVYRFETTSINIGGPLNQTRPPRIIFVTISIGSVPNR